MMILKLDRNEHRDVIETMFDLLDETFDREIMKFLDHSTFYLVLPGSHVVGELIEHLEERRMDQFVQVFTADTFADKEVVFCIADNDGAIQSIVAKVNANRGSGYTDISMSYLVRQLIEIFEARGMIAPMTPLQERAINEFIISEIPARMTARAEAVRMQHKPAPNIYV